MAEKLLVCDDCGKLFKIEYDVTEGKEIKCPSCEGTNVLSIYKKINLEER
jgi:DNA-directed RNA polymerase subunit RPC12/RpoP